MKNIARLFAYLEGRRIPLLALLLCSMLLSLGDSLVPLALSRIVERAQASDTIAIAGRHYRACFVDAGLYALLLIATTLGHNLYGHGVDRYNNGILHHLRLDAYRWMLIKRTRARLPFRDGDVITRLNQDIGSVTSMVASPLNGLLPVVLTGLFSLGMLVRLSPMFLLIALVACPILYVATARINARTKRLAAEHKARIAHLADENVNLLKNYEVYILYGDAAREYDRYEAQAKRVLDNRAQNSAALNGYFRLVGLIKAIGVVLGIGVALGGIAQGTLTAGSIVQASLYLGNVFLPILQLSRYGNQIVDAGVALQRVFDLQPDRDDALRERDAERIDAIDLARVCIAHEGHAVIDDLSLTMRRGECIVLWGKSGSGKTSLLRALAGLQPIEAGRICFDGRDVTDALCAYRRSVRLIPQTSALLHRSIRENIRYGGDDGGPIEPTLDHAALSHLCDRLDDPVHDDMSNLSGGERRRIAFARGLSAAASVYLFDEPTSKLDAASSERIRRTIAALKHDAIVVIATHDEAFQGIADRVVDLGSVAM